MFLPICFCFVLYFVDVRGFQVCYGKLGCFADGPPFVSKYWPLTFLPWSPEIMKTKFRLYTPEAGHDYQLLDALSTDQMPSTWTNLKARPTKVVIHGFLENIEKRPLWKELVYNLLKAGNFNVVFVDWSRSNSFPYTQATANTRVLGVQVANMVTAIQAIVPIKISDFHIIGHSLGAHTSGYAGMKLPGLGRITGLDPAGSFFQDADRSVRLDETDAVFVDIIHTDAVSLWKGGIGTKTLSGHIDFFANFGHDQPGCQKDAYRLIQLLMQESIIDTGTDFIACNHLRAAYYFSETINSQCPFLAHPCESEEAYKNNECHSCTDIGCRRAGYHATPIVPPLGHHIKYYFTTANETPFCQYHYFITVQLGESGHSKDGSLNLIIDGSKQMNGNIYLNGQPFHSGQSVMFNEMLPIDVGDVLSVTVYWKYHPTVLDLLPWNALNKARSNLGIEKITVYRDEASVGVTFCNDGNEIESGTDRILTKC